MSGVSFAHDRQSMSNETSHSALLIMDVQDAILGLLPDKDAYLAKVKGAVAVARHKQIRVIYVVVGFREGAPEASASQKQRAPQLINPQPTLAPVGDDIVITKRRVSAFSGSDLEIVLRAGDIRHLVLAGIATSGVVLSTVREAADKDFQLTVLSDVCADRNDEVHTFLCEKIFPNQANVTTTAEWA